MFYELPASVVSGRRGMGVALPATTASTLFVFNIVVYLHFCTRFTLFGGNLFVRVRVMDVSLTFNNL